MDRTTAIAWCAGLFEGEGTIIYGDRHNGSLQIRISSTDKDVLDLMVERSGEGKVSGPYSPNGFGKKPYFLWRANGFRAVALLREMLPYLGSRRTQRIEEKIELWEQRPVRVVADRDLMRADRAAGMTFKAIGKKHGVSLSRAHQVCHDVPRS
jgi:hypothetical protein